MDWYCYIALTAMILQIVFLIQAFNTYHYAVKKFKKKRWYRPQTVLIIPCKGLDLSFRENISSFFRQDYDNYLLWFVVADQSDPAYDELCKLRDELSGNSKAIEVQVFVAGESKLCSQKIHNLLYCYNKIGSDIDVLAFADSDICVHKDWLSHLVYPLRKSKNGAATGYRWYVPEKNNPASLALSAMNAKVAQMFGRTRFNQAWGGSMAIRLQIFRKVGLDKLWPKVLSDDLSLSHAVKKSGLKVVFVPACLVASYESMTWKTLSEFARRQFLITRVYSFNTWLFGLSSSVFSVLGLWGGIIIALLVLGDSRPDAHFNSIERVILLSLPVVFFVSQIIRAVTRQKMIWILLEKDRSHMRAACAADILFSWLWSMLMMFFILSSAFGREVCWRSIRYKLLSSTETQIIGSE
ncbi:MAG: glycosyltransferase family 2 protein [Sedimentisphaerales bacterium]|nr:glycosyltransferase family 2 protein [Sedimentisphaerales bacterium]